MTEIGFESFGSNLPHKEVTITNLLGMCVCMYTRDT